MARGFLKLIAAERDRIAVLIERGMPIGVEREYRGQSLVGDKYECRISVRIDRNIARVGQDARLIYRLPERGDEGRPRG